VNVTVVVFDDEQDVFHITALDGGSTHLTGYRVDVDLPLADLDGVGTGRESWCGPEQEESREGPGRLVAPAGSRRFPHGAGALTAETRDAGDAEVDREQKSEAPAKDADVGRQPKQEANQRDEYE
jgi:hypothetical protein